jgi:hypothetical protein
MFSKGQGTTTSDIRINVQLLALQVQRIFPIFARQRDQIMVEGRQWVRWPGACLHLVTCGNSQSWGFDCKHVRTSLATHCRRTTWFTGVPSFAKAYERPEAGFFPLGVVYPDWTARQEDCLKNRRTECPRSIVLGSISGRFLLLTELRRMGAF